MSTKETNFSILIFVFIEQIDLCVQQLMEEAVILISLYNCILYINIIIQMIQKILFTDFFGTLPDRDDLPKAKDWEDPLRISDSQEFP